MQIALVQGLDDAAVENGAVIQMRDGESDCRACCRERDGDEQHRPLLRHLRARATAESAMVIGTAASLSVL